MDTNSITDGKTRRHRNPGSITYKTIAALLANDDSLLSIAARFGVTKQCISQIYQKAVDAGIEILPRLRGRPKIEHTDKILDNRFNWKYRGCKVVPIACYRYANWGKEAEPIDFGFGPRQRYWRIDFPNQTWIHCMNKKDCRDYIDLRSPDE